MKERETISPCSVCVWWRYDSLTDCYICLNPSSDCYHECTDRDYNCDGEDLE